MSNQNKPRFREIIEGAAGNIIATALLTVLGFTTGGFVFGWLPTFIIFAIVIGVFSLWYKLDTNLQGLIRQRLFKIKHAVSGQSVVMSRWNLITEETINHIARRNNLTKKYISVEQSRVFRINNQNQDCLELVLNYTNGVKYLSLTNSSGAIIDTYGGFKSLSSDCEKCHAIILVKYIDRIGGKSVAEPITVCRRCNHQMSLSVVDFDNLEKFNVKIKSIDKHDIEIKNGKVCLHVAYTIQNSGKATRVRPHIELKIAHKDGNNHKERVAKKDLEIAQVQSHSQITKTFNWEFPVTTVIQTGKDGWLLIELKPE